MLSYAITFSVAVLVAAVLVPLVRTWATSRGLVDAPGGRKIHERPVPRLGGIAIAVAFYVALAAGVVLPLYGRLPGLPELPGIAAGGTLLVLVGLVDDLVGLSAVVKLVMQIAAGVLAYALGIGIHTLAFPWGNVDVGWLSLPLTVVWVVGVINAVNLIDGLDGLAAGVVVIALAALFVIAPNSAPLSLILAAGAGAVLGFLIYNVYPASIIMGDSGSMFLGFLVGVAAIAVASPPGGSVYAYVPAIVLALPLADMVWTVLRRASGGRPVFSADAGHVHHRLLRGGVSHRDAVLALYAVAAVFALIGIVLDRI